MRKFESDAWLHDLFASLPREEFCKELGLLCMARDIYLSNEYADSPICEYLDNVYMIMTDVLVEQALQKKDA